MIMSWGGLRQNINGLVSFFYIHMIFTCLMQVSFTEHAEVNGYTTRVYGQERIPCNERKNHSLMYNVLIVLKRLDARPDQLLGILGKLKSKTQTD